MSLRHHQSGFTIIELMVAVAIVGILVAVAVPSYRDYVRKGQIPEGLSLLSDLRVKMETYYQDNRNYGDGKCASNTGAAWAGFSGGESKFDLRCELDGGQRYTIIATGKSGTTVDGYSYSIDQDNQKRTILFKRDVVNKPCWLVRGAEC